MELPRSSGITVNSSAPDSRRHILLHQVSLRANSGRLAKIGCLLILAGCLCLLDELRLLALGPRYVHAEVWLNLLAATLGLYGVYLDPQKRPLNVPPEVLPIPADKWAEQVATLFRHITIDRKFF